MDLVPGNKYYLKWSSMFKTKPKINNLLILECEFVKFRDDTHYNDYNRFFELIEEYFYQDPDQLPEINELRRRLSGKILTEEGDEHIEFPFVHPFFPYTIRKLKSDNVGLFKLLNVFKTINKGVPDKPFTNYNLIRFFEFSNNVAINTWNKDGGNYEPNLIPGETLLWVNLNNVKIIEADVAQRILEYKTLTELENKLPLDMTHEIAGFVGSNEYLHKKHKGGKKSKKLRKSKKNKSKRRY